MTSQELPGLVEAWFKRDPVTGNFVQAVPPKQFTTEQIQALAEKYISLAAENEWLREALEQIEAACNGVNNPTAALYGLYEIARKALSGGAEG